MTVTHAQLAEALGITEDELTALNAIEEQGHALASSLARMARADMEARAAGTLDRNGDHSEQALTLWRSSSPEVQESAAVQLAFHCAHSSMTGEAVK